MKTNYLKILLTVILISFLSGCATYNAARDPVYQSYLRGDISYADYVQHYDALMAQQQTRVMMFQQSMNRIADGLKTQPKATYDVRSTGLGGYTIKER